MSKLKSFAIILLGLLAVTTASAQQYSFNMREVDGGNYTVSVDLTNKRVSATSNGSTEFNYTYTRYQYDNQKGIIGFAFGNGSVPMRPADNFNTQYFLVRSNSIYANNPSAKKGYKFEPTNMSNYASVYSSLFAAVSERKAEPKIEPKAEPRAEPRPEYSSSGSYKTFTVNGVTFKMIYVQGGTFTMGATSEQGSDAYSDETPTHSVTLSSYYIGETEVTQELWQALMGSNPSSFKGSRKPVDSVSYNDCIEFISKLNSKTGQSFRLPTEAEWEYAARGGNKSRTYKYSGSNTIDNVAWYEVNSYNKGSSSPDYGTHNVATKSPNELGIYDMSGNVWEWCSDWRGSYSSSSQTNPTGASSGSIRVLRGGSWGSYAGYCRVANRGNA